MALFGKKSSANVRPIRTGQGAGLPMEGFYPYFLMSFLGLLTADLAVMSIREKMLPATSLASGSKPLALAERPIRSEYEGVLTRNIFNSDGVIPPAVGAKKTDQPEEPKDDVPVLSQLPMQLVGTIVHANPAKSLATIEIKNGGKILPFAPNDDIEGLAELLKVERKKAIFRNRNNRRVEYIEIKDDAPIAKRSSSKKPEGEGIQGTGNDFTVKRGELNKMLENLPEILQQARAVPNILPGSGGKIDGFKVLDIAPGSIFEKIGIQKLDVIKRVNGQEVDSPAKAMELYQQLRSSGYVQLEIERGGRMENMSYNIVE